MDIPLLGQFSKKDSLPGAPSLTRPESHPESTILRMLHGLNNPPPHHSISNWAKSVAISIQTISDEIPVQSSPNLHSESNELARHVKILSWLQQQKTMVVPSLKIIDIDHASTPQPNPSENIGIHDQLEQLRILIIDMMMSCTLLRARGEDNVNPRKITKRRKSNSGNVVNNEVVLRDQLSDYQTHHNFLPFVFFLACGVRGIFIASRDRRSHSISSCMEFVCALEAIKSHSKTPAIPRETIWINLGIYLRKIVGSVFNSPSDDISQFITPTRHALAQAIAHDFMNHCNGRLATNPAPPASRLITASD